MDGDLGLDLPSGQSQKVNLDDSFNISDEEADSTADTFDKIKKLGEKREPIQSLRTTLMEYASNNRPPPFLSIRFNPNFGSTEAMAFFRQRETMILHKATNQLIAEYAVICEEYLKENADETKTMYQSLKRDSMDASQINELKNKVKRAVQEGKLTAEKNRKERQTKKRMGQPRRGPPMKRPSKKFH